MSLPDKMSAMVTIGHGDLDQMVFHEDWPRPEPASGEVLVWVKACGLNNTDVNTRSGWYSKAVSEATTGGAFEEVGEDDPTWGGAPVSFPRIQGADVCGEVVAVGDGVSQARIGERIISDNWLRDPQDPLNKDKCAYYGSERDGGFAQYTTLPASNAIAVKSDLSDAELATFSCSFSTAEGMLTRANVGPTDTVLVTGASGGVGGALVQLAKRRGARVIAMASEAKHGDVA
ncbi:MAG: alcohol dehydrogenase catalytic domain-containing protein, partial [Pseudomonadota bacterium]